MRRGGGEAVRMASLLQRHRGSTGSRQNYVMQEGGCVLAGPKHAWHAYLAGPSRRSQSSRCQRRKTWGLHHTTPAANTG